MDSDSPLQSVVDRPIPIRQGQERLSPDDLAYHRHVLGQQRDVQAIVQSWSGYLTQKWKLQPGDQVMEDGNIARRPSADRT